MPAGLRAALVAAENISGNVHSPREDVHHLCQLVVAELCLAAGHQLRKGGVGQRAQPLDASAAAQGTAENRAPTRWQADRGRLAMCKWWQCRKERQCSNNHSPSPIPSQSKVFRRSPRPQQHLLIQQHIHLGQQPGPAAQHTQRAQRTHEVSGKAVPGCREARLTGQQAPRRSHKPTPHHPHPTRNHFPHTNCTLT